MTCYQAITLKKDICVSSLQSCAVLIMSCNKVVFLVVQESSSFIASKSLSKTQSVAHHLSHSLTLIRPMMLMLYILKASPSMTSQRTSKHRFTTSRQYQKPQFWHCCIRFDNIPISVIAQVAYSGIRFLQTYEHCSAQGSTPGLVPVPWSRAAAGTWRIRRKF